MPSLLSYRWIYFPILLALLILLISLKPSISQGQSILDIKSCSLHNNIFNDDIILNAKALSISDSEISINVEGRNKKYQNIRCRFYCTTASEDGQMLGKIETRKVFSSGKPESFAIACPPLTNKNASKLILTIERNNSNRCPGGKRRLPPILWKNCKP